MPPPETTLRRLSARAVRVPGPCMPGLCTRVVALVLAATLPLAAADEAQVDKAREASAAVVRGNLDQAITLFGEALLDKSVPNDRRAMLHNDRGVAYARRGQPREAIEDYNRAIQLYPEFAAVYNNRGNLLLGLDALKEAIKDFDRAIALSPGYSAAYSNRAGAYIKLGDVDKAFADYARAVELTPNSPAALTGRGRAHLAAFRPYAAMRDFSRAVAVDARFSPAYRARAEAKVGVERYEDAIEDFSRAIAFEPRNAEIYILRGNAYLDADNVASASKDYATAIELNPRSALAHAARGFASARAENYEEALADLAKAIDLDPRSGLPYAYRAFVYRQQQETDLAQREAERALKLDPNAAEGYWARGEIQAALGHGDEARDDFRRAVELGMRLKEARRALARLETQPAALPEVEGAGLDGWRVYRSGRQFLALNEAFPRLRIALEMTGADASPRILEWQVRQAPLEGIAVLRFAAGSLTTASGAEALEHAAIVDLASATVIAVQVHRQGDRVARWTWDDARVVVAAADGLTDELQLRPAKPREVSQAQVPRREAYTTAPRKPKTLLEMLFNFKF